MAATEKRLPREVFTKKLRRICQRLDEVSTRAISYKYTFMRSATTDEITVLDVWVVGSYARGAPLCGDLDIVLRVQGKKKGQPRAPSVTNAFFGNLPYVRYYLGDPVTNESGVEFSDAVRIWSGPSCAWQAAIDAIQIDPLAGRAPRLIDEIPFRLEQLHSDIDQLEEVLEARRSGLVEWDFVPLPAGLLVMPEEADDQRYELAINRYTHDWGRKSKALIPSLVMLMRELEPQGEWMSASYEGENADLRCGGTRLFVGRPRILTSLLDGNASVRQLAVVPHISIRGPTGAWLIRRGPRHPDVLALASATLYYHLEQGRPMTMTSGGHRSFAAEILEVFDSHAEAEEYSVWESDEDTITMDVGQVSGASILQILGLCDVVMIGGKNFAINHRGKRHTEANALTVVELAAHLRALPR